MLPLSRGRAPLYHSPPPSPAPGMALVLYASTDGFTPERFAAALALLPASEQARILRFQQAADQVRSLLGRLLLRQGLSLFGEDPEGLGELRYTTYGKPYFADAKLDFNISHAGTLVVCAVTTGNRVGIDLEQLRPLSLSGYEATLDPAQWDETNAAADPSERFLTFWTKKEAIVKCRGEGLTLPLQEITGLDDLSLEGETWRCLRLEIQRGFVCHAVTKIPPSSWKVLPGLC